VIHKTFTAETKVLDPAQGVVECVFSATGNVDRQGDRIVPGAFAKALAGKSSVPVVFAHAWADISQVLGRTTSMRELMPGDPSLPDSLRSKGYGGVKATIQFEMGVQSGREAFTHLKNGNLTQYSFAFDIDTDGEKTEGNVREIKSISELFEVTVALIGANQLTTTLIAKAENADAEFIATHVAEQSERERAPVWLKDALGQLETAARIAEPARESAIEAEEKSIVMDDIESRTDPSTRPDFSQKLEPIDETATAESQNFATSAKSKWAEITGHANASHEAGHDWRSEFSGASDMSKYVAKLQAEKAAERQTEQDRYEELRRKMGISANYGR
jgi:HK97 family phage prohead protease